jgi:Fur family peroxide stress response transcriptional regulator
MDSDKDMDFAAICRENGWKRTPQRIAVYEFINGNMAHPGVDEAWNHIRKTLPSVTRESIYRILNEFAERGLLHRMNHLNSAKYDSQTGPHGHFICEKCGKVVDFSFPEEFPLPSGENFGAVRNIELRLSGVCKDCQIKSKE